MVATLAPAESLAKPKAWDEPSDVSEHLYENFGARLCRPRPAAAGREFHRLWICCDVLRLVFNTAALRFQTGTEMNELWQSEKVITHTACLARSLKHFTGRELFSGASHTLDLAEKVFAAPFVLVSHGTEADPVLNYGNRTALTLWEMTWDELTRTPSRLTAEAPNREERARLLAAVTSHGFIDDYSGVRISKSGRRFRIHRATVWNLVTEAGQPCGQAAMFDQWEFV